MVRFDMSGSDDEAGADAANEEDCLVPAESADEADDDFSPFDEVAEGFANEPLQKVIGPDGLPTPVDPGQRSDIPPLSLKTLVCMGDFSKFVIRGGFGEVIAEFALDEVERSPNGSWRAKRELVLDRASLEIKRIKAFLEKHKNEDGVQHLLNISDQALFTHALGQWSESNGAAARMSYGWIEVEPIRPPCRHYVRQITQFEYNPENDVVIRLCSARRTTEGAFMSVRDRKIAACDMREPRDLESEKIIDDFDTRKIKEGAEREYFPIFGGFGPSGKPGDGKPIICERS